jgi:uncharacterized iron-regulated membrane protein
VESSSRQGLFRIHAWIGLQLGYLLFAICLTGTLAVLSAELVWLVNPQQRIESRANAAAPFSWQKLQDAVAAAHPQATLLYLHAPDGPRSPARATLAYGPQDYRGVAVDPHSYAVSESRSSFGLQSFLRILHKQFYLVSGVIGFHGTLIVGLLALPLLVAIYTGLVSVRRWWRAMRQVRRGRSPRLFWSDLHRFAGLWAAVITLLLALTGLWYFAELLLQDARLIREDPPVQRLSAAALAQRPAVLPPFDLDAAATAAQAAWPGIELSQLALPQRPDDPLVFTGQAEAWLVRARANRILVDPLSNTVLQMQRAEDLPLLQRWIATADPLHFGNFGGLASKLVWFAAGLLLCGGILSGLISAWLRLQRHPDPGLSRTSMVAAFCTLLLLGAAAHGAVVYGYGYQRLSQQPRALLMLGGVTAGPWQMQLSLVMSGARLERIELHGAGMANVRTATLEGAALRRAGSKLWIAADAVSCNTGCRLEIEDWSGARHVAAMDLAPERASQRVALPLAGDVSRGESLLIALSVALLLLPLGFWLWLLWRAGTPKRHPRA